jgi:hypothetical protein
LREGGDGRCLIATERAAMPAWPKSFLTFGANLLTARTAMRLRRRDRAVQAQRTAFRSLLRHLEAASYWRDAGVVASMSYEQFRSRVAPRTHAALATPIARMQAGEADVLWPGTCTLFAASAGTTTGEARVVPVTTPMLAHFRTACRDALLYYTARTGHVGVFHGRHLFLTGSTALQPVATGTNHPAFVGAWPAIAQLNLPRWAETQVYEPGTTVAAMTDWPAKIEAIIGRTANADITLLAGMPPWVLSFAETLQAKRAEAGQPIDNLQALWPNLECFVHGGTPVAPYQSELRKLLGPGVEFHEVYAAAEGIFAAQDTAVAGELRLFSTMGVFFEFLPLTDFDPSRLDSIGEKAVGLADVQPGVPYVLLLTTPAGLARYVVGDIVRFTSLEPPRITYVGRTALQLSAFGEHVIEKDVMDVLLSVCQRHRWTIVNFHVAPLFDVDLTGQARGRHEWWVELKPGTVETPTGPQMAVELDTELQRVNPAYATRRGAGRIDSPTVRLVMPGVFRHWMRFHGKIDGQHRVARCRSDRLIADELAQITKFARD